MRYAPVLDRGEQERLLNVMRRRKGSKADRLAAREKLIVSNLRLVEAELSTYRRNPYVDLDDLRQAGMLGLIKAVDAAPAAPAFKSYARITIRFAMVDAFTRSDSSGITGSTDAIRLAARYSQAISELEAVGLSRSQAVAAVAAGAGVNTADVLTSLPLVEASLSFDYRPEGDDGLSTMEAHAGVAPSADSLLVALEDKQATVDALGEVLRSLPPLEVDVLARRHGVTGVGDKAREVAGELGVSVQLVLAAEDRGMARLRHPSRAARLLDL